MNNKNTKSWSKEFDDFWDQWVNLSGIKTGTNFKKFKSGIKSVVARLLKSQNIKPKQNWEEEFYKTTVKRFKDWKKVKICLCPMCQVGRFIKVNK